MTEFDVRMFGRFRVLRDGVEMEPPIGLAATAFKILVLNSGVVHHEKLIERLWPKDPPHVGRARLKNVLARVRRDTGASIRTRRGATVELQDPVRCDLVEFLREGPRALSGVLTRDECLRLQALWVGPPLEDNRYDAWAEDVRQDAYELKERLWAMLDTTRDPRWPARHGGG